MWYLVLAEKRRQDITIVDPFAHNTEIEYADLVWPADLDLEQTDRRFGTDDFSGVKSARIAAEKGPVYVLSQDQVPDPERYEGAGFRVVEVEKNILYRLIPQE